MFADKLQAQEVVLYEEMHFKSFQFKKQQQPWLPDCLTYIICMHLGWVIGFCTGNNSHFVYFHHHPSPIYTYSIWTSACITDDSHSISKIFLWLRWSNISWILNGGIWKYINSGVSSPFLPHGKEHGTAASRKSGFNPYLWGVRGLYVSFTKRENN